MHWVGSETWINEMAPEQHRGRIVSAYATIWSMGIAAGPLILKFIGVDGALPFIVSGCLMAGAALPLLIVGSETGSYCDNRWEQIIVAGNFWSL